MKFPSSFSGIHGVIYICTLAFTMAGCGSQFNTGSGISICGVPAGSGNTASVESRSTYPDGPYGLEVCSVIKNLDTFIRADGSKLSFQDIRQNPDSRLLLISTSAGWCTACIEEQPALEALYDSRNADGLEVLVALFQDASFFPATAMLVEQWIAKYKLDLQVVADPANTDSGEVLFGLSAYYDTRLTPMNMLIDLETMTILEVVLGWDEERMTSKIDAMLGEGAGEGEGEGE